MAIIPRAQQTVGINPTPVRQINTGAEQIGGAVQRFGDAIGGLAETMVKEREDLDSFQTKMTLQKFHNEQELRQRDYDASITGDGRDHTAARLQEFDAARDEVMASLPNNEKQRQTAMLYTEQLRGNYGERALVTQRNHIDTYKAESVVNLAYGTIIPQISGDPSTINAALAQAEMTIAGSGMTEAKKDQARKDIAAAALERWVDQSGASVKDEADAIIAGYGKGLPQAANGPDFRGKRGPAPIRYNNPGAQYPGPSARKYGATETEVIGGGHKIAVFPDAVSGAAAQFDLLATKYTGQPLSAAIRKWSGGNWSAEYVQKIARDTGLQPDTMLTAEILKDPATAIPLAKAMAEHEAGEAYPMSDEQWAQAHSMANGGTGDPVGTSSAQGYFVRGLTMNLDRISERAKKLKEEDDALTFVDDAINGRGAFNPYNAEHRKIVDKAFEKASINKALFEGDEAAMEKAAEVSQTLNYVPEALGAAMLGAINQKDPERRAVGYRTAASILANQPYALEKMQGGADLKKEAEDYSALVNIGNESPENAIAKIDEMRSPEWKKLEEGRKVLVDGKTGILATLQPADLESAFDTSFLGLGSNPSVGEGNSGALLFQNYKGLVRENYIRYGDEKIAKQVAIGQLKRSFGVSEVTGSKVITRYPIERTYPAVGGSHDYVGKQLQEDMRSATGKTIDLGAVEYRGDDQTARELKTGKPTYVVVYRDENGLQQRLPGRWHPDVEEAQSGISKEFENRPAASTEPKPVMTRGGFVRAPTTSKVR